MSSSYHKSGVIINYPAMLLNDGKPPTITSLPDVVLRENEELFICIPDAFSPDNELGTPDGYTAIKVRCVCENPDHEPNNCQSRLPIVPEFGEYPIITIEEWEERYGNGDTP